MLKALQMMSRTSRQSSEGAGKEEDKRETHAPDCYFESLIRLLFIGGVEWS